MGIIPHVLAQKADLSDDKDTVINFVEYCNLKKIEMSRFYDEIDNFLK